VDVRVIAATHQDLDELVKRGRFREDLYHRLNVIRVRIPPLRERREDVPLLMRHFLARAAQELKTDAKRLRPEVLALLKAFDWPGNVRQLENTCRWLTVMAPGLDIHAQDLPAELKLPGPGRPGIPTGSTIEESPMPMPQAAPPAHAAPPAVVSMQWDDSLRGWIQAQLQDGRVDVLAEAAPRFERALIETALRECGGQRIEAARRLGWGRNTLTRKIKELGIED
jgi:two-component system nitrogen regulation response regulator GlnG